MELQIFLHVLVTFAVFVFAARRKVELSQDADVLVQIRLVGQDFCSPDVIDDITYSCSGILGKEPSLHVGLNSMVWTLNHRDVISRDV